MLQLAPSGVFSTVIVCFCLFFSFSRSLLSISCILICAFILFLKVSLYLAVLGFIALQALSLVQHVGAAHTERVGFSLQWPLANWAPGAWSGQRRVDLVAAGAHRLSCCVA